MVHLYSLAWSACILWSWYCRTHFAQVLQYRRYITLKTKGIFLDSWTVLEQRYAANCSSWKWLPFTFDPWNTCAITRRWESAVLQYALLHISSPPTILWLLQFGLRDLWPAAVAIQVTMVNPPVPLCGRCQLSPVEQIRLQFHSPMIMMKGRKMIVRHLLFNFCYLQLKNLVLKTPTNHFAANL